MTEDTNLKQLKVFVTEQHMAIMREYGRKHNILATTGRHVGQPHLSAVIRLAIEKLLTDDEPVHTLAVCTPIEE